jgi:hypothetical protein
MQRLKTERNLRNNFVRPMEIHTIAGDEHMIERGHTAQPRHRNPRDRPAHAIEVDNRHDMVAADGRHSGKHELEAAHVPPPSGSAGQRSA